jgi:heme/copper-type cytochrome/quinol oxidase subunit 3
MEIPHEVTPRRDTGLYNAKLGVWLFLASEVMLFGGLFSAYVFLRLGVQDGVDNPWPWGLNVHKGYVWAGFINTLVLIASSVGSSFRLGSVEREELAAFPIPDVFSRGLCRRVHVHQGGRYNSKLTKHHGIKLIDNSVMEGKILKGTDKIRFDAKSVSFGLQGAHPIFLKEIAGDEFPVLTVEPADGEDGEPIQLTSKGEFKKWFNSARREVGKRLAEDRKRYRGELASGVANPTPVSVATSATVTAEKPFSLEVNPRNSVAHTDSVVNYRDGSKAEGVLTGDDVLFEVHEVDMQLVLPTKQRDSILWDIVDDEGAKKEFFEAQQKWYNKMRDYYEARGEVIPEKMLRGHKLNLQYVHVGGHKGDGHEKGEEHEDDVHSGETNPSAASGEEHESQSKLHLDHGHSTPITVPRDQIKFMGNHGPRYGNYYAIYFTMTALHGLHVVGGALVLLYFVVFGKKIYKKNPEHLANRVEVGGLFWHFVDLIWIFLFPIMYLL